MPIQPKRRLSPEEYLEIERQANHKSEYFDGEMFAFAGASFKHNTIIINLILHLGPEVRKRQCHLHSNDMRIKVIATGLYTYPDVFIVCNKPQFEDEHEDTILNPIVIIEVLSPSTENYDRGSKFAHYRTISSLSDYILVAQDKIHVEHYARQSDFSWLLTEYNSLENTFKIEAIDCDVSIAKIYENLELESR
jgi:Uma2 family endonuclease